MFEEKFRVWLKQRYNKKVISDNISRLRKISREIENVDDEYSNDRCAYLLSLFKNLGDNPEMKRYNSNLPVGSDSIRCYKYALMNYIKFRQQTEGKAND